MSVSIVIIGAGFAGVWSALSAKRLINLKDKGNAVKVLVVAPEPSLAIRPRLYEANTSNMFHHLGPLFESAGIEFLQGRAETINTTSKSVQVRSTDNQAVVVEYNQLILAAGSSLNRPQSVSGIEEHAFDIDTLDSAAVFDRHLKTLPSLEESTARNTFVVCGAGFSGIELAAELPSRLTHINSPKIILVESAEELGPELGPGPRPTIKKALKELGVEVRLGSPVSAVDAEGVELASGERIPAETVIWTAGMRASTLAKQIPGPKDALGRLHVNRFLQTEANYNVFATGDTAFALADTEGHHALMSCQHALQLGRVSGHNAAAAVLGEPMTEYTQAAYNCCLDLGSWGAVITGGWEREVKFTGDKAKRVKEFINQKLIYPPDDAQKAFDLANPIGPDSDEIFKYMLAMVE
ncbi:hypothetical protein CkaCkLH20_11091 [Colletotrichum karsti]|uniref:FAD/NAD(P)-binding domain-containing protein n=1 Tax=Colletotrichum karsti TaxID=1095194 RepID=A0A9P6HVW2_9PEZI|nr:uncharacterized protein CkaCkLH20_11091 [Colletotrichum karsti]KAF9871444.1 hypothetical protein CkaCkLH20_11091 [Colletotrichum karsti]